MAVVCHHVYQLTAGFGVKSSRKCDTDKKLDFPTFRFGTRSRLYYLVTYFTR
jgi:hypothetical protein